MQVSFNPNISFKSESTQKTIGVEERLAGLEEKLDSYTQKTDSLENPPKPKKTFRDFVANVAKFFTALGQMTKGIVKGAFFGTVAGFTLAGGAWLFRSKPDGIINAFKQPGKVIGTKGKVLAWAGASLVAGYHIVKAKLRTNKGTANVDHQLKTGHRRK